MDRNTVRMARKKQVELNLKQKLEVLKYVKDHGERSTAAKFSISKTTVNNIKKNAQLLKERLKTENTKMKRKYRSSRFGQINNMTIDWFHRMRAMDARVSGPMLQEAALFFAEEIHLTEFKASNGWLDSFKKRHNMSSKLLSGESNEIDEEVVQQFYANIESFVAGYRDEDIFNADECGLFFKALPNRSLAIKGDKCKSGKQSKVRLSILLAASATGEKLRPFVIGKYLKPRCFKNVKMKDLPVTYTVNKKAWMTSKLFEHWVSSVNKDMKKQNRKILLIVDNCPAHPEMANMSNVKLKFLPPNTTSALQPMDQGIIKNFKLFYRKLLLRMVVTKSDQGQSASVIAKSVTVLHAIQWIEEAWKNVKVETITNCFRKAGFILTDVDRTSKTSQTTEEELMMKSRIRIDGVEYVFEDFVCCDEDVAITKVFDARELQEAVLQDLELDEDDFDDEDLIPLSELRSRVITNIQNSNEEDVDLLSISTRNKAPINDEVIPQISKMLHDIFLFANKNMPEMIDPIKMCRDLLVKETNQQ